MADTTIPAESGQLIDPPGNLALIDPSELARLREADAAVRALEAMLMRCDVALDYDDSHDTFSVSCRGIFYGTRVMGLGTTILLRHAYLVGAGVLPALDEQEPTDDR